MKSILLAILCTITISSILPLSSNAQFEDSDIKQEVQITTQEERPEVTPMPQVVVQPNFSFFAILIAVLTPAIFIIIGYMLVKHFKL